MPGPGSCLRPGRARGDARAAARELGARTPAPGLPRTEVVRYRRDSCVLRYELAWHLPAQPRSLKQVLYGKVYGDSRAARRPGGDGAPGAGPGASLPFLVPRFQGYLPDVRLALLEAVPESAVLPQLIPRAGRRRRAGAASLLPEGAVIACARIAAALHRSSIPVGAPRTSPTRSSGREERPRGSPRWPPRSATSLHRHPQRDRRPRPRRTGSSSASLWDFGHSAGPVRRPRRPAWSTSTRCAARSRPWTSARSPRTSPSRSAGPRTRRAAHDGEALGDAFLREYVRLSGTPRSRRPARPRRRVPDGGTGPPRRPELVPTEATATRPRPGAPGRTAAYPDRRAVTPRGGTSKSIDTPGHGSCERGLTVASFEASPACRGPHGVHMTGTDRRILRSGALPAITIVRWSRFSGRRGGAVWR